MKTTIDRAGRIVIPKALREAVGLEPGTVVDLACREGRLEVAPAAAAVRLVRRSGLLVAEAADAGEVLTQADVDSTLAAVRAEREG